jgi:hypothetical protein
LRGFSTIFVVIIAFLIRLSVCQKKVNLSDAVRSAVEREHAAVLRACDPLADVLASTNEQTYFASKTIAIVFSICMFICYCCRLSKESDQVDSTTTTTTTTTTATTTPSPLTTSTTADAATAAAQPSSPHITEHRTTLLDAAQREIYDLLHDSVRLMLGSSTSKLETLALDRRAQRRRELLARQVRIPLYCSFTQQQQQQQQQR